MTVMRGFRLIGKTGTLRWGVIGRLTRTHLPTSAAARRRIDMPGNCEPSLESRPSERRDSGFSWSHPSTPSISYADHRDLESFVSEARQADAFSDHEVGDPLLREAMQLRKYRRRAATRGLERTSSGLIKAPDAPTSGGRISKHSGRKPFQLVRAATRKIPSPTLTPYEPSSVGSPDLSEPGGSLSPHSREGSWERDERWLLSLPENRITTSVSVYSNQSSAASP